MTVGPSEVGETLKRCQAKLGTKTRDKQAHRDQARTDLGNKGKAGRETVQDGDPSPRAPSTDEECGLDQVPWPVWAPVSSQVT